nr:3392_t:CDS:10 [Entrophospora candida]
MKRCESNNNEQQSSRERKRAKKFSQRNIETFGEGSTKAPTYTPKIIDVLDFAEARAFEINAMNNALERSSQAKNSKVSQTLPRHLRRRAASHNVKRLPARLRQKATEEMEHDNTVQKKTSGHKKRYSGTIAEEYKRRKANKKWLETHIWHAKRMKMINIWGYKLAEHPNEKSVRSSFRASEHLSIIQDASYFEWLSLSGSEANIVKLMNSVTDPTLPSIGSQRYLNGKRQCFTYLYSFLKYPSHLIAPINLIWKPLQDFNQRTTRHILIWIHPCVFQEAIGTLESAIKKLELNQGKLKTVNDFSLKIFNENNFSSTDLIIENLQDEFLIFELTGPRSTALLQTVLDVYDGNDDNGNGTNMSIDKNQRIVPYVNKDAHNAWKSLNNLRSATSLPPGIVLGLTVIDPRLKFPKKVPSRSDTISVDSENAIQRILFDWPDNVAFSDIWNNDLRKSLQEIKVSEGNLNKRRSRLLVPGQKLQLTSNDALIPILLIQRDSMIKATSIKGKSSEYIGGWNIIMPSGWGMDFWKSFVFAGAWVGGLRERHNNHFENGLICFPYDYPGTKSYEEYSKQQKLLLESEHNKRPSAKRPNYKKLFVESPFEPPFYQLTGHVTKNLADVNNDNKKVEEEEEEEEIDTQKPLLFHGLKNIKLLEKFHSSTNNSFKNTFISQIKNSYKEKNVCLVDDLSFDLDRFIVCVSLNLLGKGVPGYNAIIYKTSQEIYDHWSNLLKNKKIYDEMDFFNGEMNYGSNIKKDHNLLPKPSEIIGYVTTGKFSFSQGHGFAIGCCSLIKILELLRQQKSEKRTIKNFVLVRKITSLICQPATLELIS